MALNFPDPATQTPVNTFSPTSTPSASTNGITYLWDGQKWNAQTNGDAAFWQRVGTTLSPATVGDNISTTGDISSADVTASSEVKAPSLLNAATTGDPNITLNADGSTLIRNLQNSQRNMVDNGAMAVAQRTTSATGVTTPGNYCTDRFSEFIVNLGTWTSAQVNDDAPASFAFSKKLTCTTADASPAGSDRLNVSHTFEGFDLDPARTGPGSGMRSLQFSFWVKSNKTGKASINIFQPQNSLSAVVLVYEIKSANTWEHIHLTVPADASAVIPSDNSGALVVEWWLNSGSDFQGGVAQPAWAPLTSANRNINNLGVGGAVNDYFAITGVQLTATDAPIEFQHEDYGTTLAKCQRYFQKLPEMLKTIRAVNGTSVFADTNVPLFVPMRATPSLTFRRLSGDLVNGPVPYVSRINRFSVNVIYNGNGDGGQTLEFDGTAQAEL